MCCFPFSGNLVTCVYKTLPQSLFGKVHKFIPVARSLCRVLCTFLKRQMYPRCLPLSLLVFSATVSFAGVVPDGGSGLSVDYDRSDAGKVEREEKLRELDHQSSGWELSWSDAVQEKRRDEGTIGAVTIYVTLAHCMISDLEFVADEAW